MDRRYFLTVSFSFGALLLSGCTSDEDSSVPSSTSTSSPTPTPQPPLITSINPIEVPDPRGLNPIGFRINYKNFDTRATYKLEVTVESDVGTNTKTVQVPKKQGIYPGLVGLRIEPPAGTSTESDTILYSITLIENGTDIETYEGGFRYE